jgi:hypothetical protein
MALLGEQQCCDVNLASCVAIADGDTWLDVSSDYTALQAGIAQWYDNTLYVSSLGQGISAKVFNETA